MNLIMERLNLKKLILPAVMLAGLMGGTSAFALGTVSLAQIVNYTDASGPNINVWDGSAYLSGKNTTTKGDRTFNAKVKKSVAVLQDPIMYSKRLYDYGDSFTRVKVSLPEESTYYAHADSWSFNGYGYAKLESD